MKILVTTGHGKSRYTIALLHKLISKGHFEILCVEVETFNLKRFLKYLRQYGYKTLIQKFLVNFSDNVENDISNETLPIKNYLQKKNITFKTVKSFCKQNKINHYVTNNLNSTKTYDKYNKEKIDLIIYSGGGILRKNFIEIPKIGVLNAHSGYLPNYRGMNAIEWSVFCNFKPHTTIHFIDPGIDTGKILYSEPIPSSKDLYTFRGNAVVHNIKLIFKVLNNFKYYIENMRTQENEFGKQYYVMHSELKKVVQEKLKEKTSY